MLQRERKEHARIERERAERARADREKLLRERARRQAQLKREREHRRRKDLPRQKAKRKGTAAPRRKAAVAAVSRRRTPPPRSRSHQRRPQGLGWPTARAALALAAVTAVAGVMGAALGLPVPVLGGPGGPIAASLTGNSLLDSGTPPGLTKGPYFPVVTDNPDFGEADARFGANRSGHIHQGQDVFVKAGTPLVAVRDGIVIDGAGGKSLYAYGGGNSLVIYSPMDDRSYVYMHMLHPALAHAGETVQAGQPIGQVGCTGSCDGPHLHFEIRRGRVGHRVERRALDPLPYLQEWPAAPTE
jgi:murein DD-endopeptidase MepM/ murein hydrolase activator NlpD